MSNTTTLRQDLADALALLPNNQKNELNVTIHQTQGLNFSKLPSHTALTRLEINISAKELLYALDRRVTQFKKDIAEDKTQSAIILRKELAEVFPSYFTQNILTPAAISYEVSAEIYTSYFTKVSKDQNSIFLIGNPNILRELPFGDKIKVQSIDFPVQVLKSNNESMAHFESMFKTDFEHLQTIEQTFIKSIIPASDKSEDDVLHINELEDGFASSTFTVSSDTLIIVGHQSSLINTIKQQLKNLTISVNSDKTLYHSALRIEHKWIDISLII